MSETRSVVMLWCIHALYMYTPDADSGWVTCLRACLCVHVCMYVCMYACGGYVVELFRGKGRGVQRLLNLDR